MKLCLKCETTFPGNDWKCPSCDFMPTHENNHLVFSPEHINTSSGFEEIFFEDLYKIEKDSFWFNSRNKLITWALNKYFPKVHNFLEVGCGTGFVLSAIEKKFSNLDLYGTETFSKGLSFASSRVAKAKLLQVDARELPFEDEFDVIGAFDVIEHIKDDNKVLQGIYRALKPTGGVIITVPQHMFLWSKVDEYSHHVRRYSSQDLKQGLEAAGFKVVMMTSFVTLLLPFMMVSRAIKNNKDISPEGRPEFNLSTFVNAIFNKIMSFELLFIKAGMQLPFGGSLLAVACKETK